MVIQMTGVGEKTGNLGGMLLKLADFYDEEVDAAVDSVVSMIEPLIIVFLGGAVGGLLIAMYMPMFSMGDAIKGWYFAQSRRDSSSQLRSRTFVRYAELVPSLARL